MKRDMQRRGCRSTLQAETGFIHQEELANDTLTVTSVGNCSIKQYTSEDILKKLSLRRSQNMSNHFMFLGDSVNRYRRAAWMSLIKPDKRKSRLDWGTHNEIKNKEGETIATLEYIRNDLLANPPINSSAPDVLIFGTNLWHHMLLDEFCSPGVCPSCRLLNNSFTAAVRNVFYHDIYSIVP